MTFPPLDIPPRADRYVPDEEQCSGLWEKYGMLDNIKAHSLAVARLAVQLADTARRTGYDIRVDEVLAAGLLHDLAKTYTIHYGGAHDQLGASWVAEETGNRVLAQAVLFHVRWPWQEGELAPDRDPLRLPLLLSYADKRVRHNGVVSLRERFADLSDRYGTTPAYRESIARNFEQSMEYEQLLIKALGPYPLP